MSVEWLLPIPERPQFCKSEVPSGIYRQIHIFGPSLFSLPIRYKVVTYFLLFLSIFLENKMKNNNKWIH